MVAFHPQQKEREREGLSAWGGRDPVSSDGAGPGTRARSQSVCSI